MRGVRKRKLKNVGIFFVRSMGNDLGYFIIQELKKIKK
jgi:hypothetical protein